MCGEGNRRGRSEPARSSLTPQINQRPPRERRRSKPRSGLSSGAPTYMYMVAPSIRSYGTNRGQSLQRTMTSSSPLATRRSSLYLFARVGPTVRSWPQGPAPRQSRSLARVALSSSSFVVHIFFGLITATGSVLFVLDTASNQSRVRKAVVMIFVYAEKNNMQEKGLMSGSRSLLVYEMMTSDAGFASPSLPVDQAGHMEPTTTPELTA